MNVRIALFRGINVGGHHNLPMGDLKGILENLGYSQIRTLLQSGNAIFRSSGERSEQIARDIETAICENHGFRPETLVLETADLKKAIDRNPFPTDEGKALHFYFLSALPESPDIESLNRMKDESEEFRLIGKVFYLYAPHGIGRSKTAAMAERCLGVPVTARNGNTVRKLIDAAGAAESPRE